jgi:hypothetical protein
MNEQQQHDKQPELHLTNAKQLTFEQMIDLVRRLTGREPMPEEVEEARREWEQGCGG